MCKSEKPAKQKISKLSFFTKNVLWGIIISLICIAAIIYLTENHPQSNIVSSIIIPILTAIIAGFIVSFVIDIKKQVSGIQELIVKSFTENTFLEHLSDDEISKLRKDALSQLIQTQYPNMQYGLIEKDAELSEVLTEPYYEIFRETGIYYRGKKFKWTNEGNEEKVLFRDVNIQYTLKTPQSPASITVADLSVRKSLLFPTRKGTLKSPQEIFKISEFTVIIDEKSKIDIKDSLHYDCSEVSSIEDYYNQKISITYDGDYDEIKKENNGKAGIFVPFHESLTVHIRYEIYLPLEDNHFTNRLRYPAKSYRIDCYCNDDNNVRFYGELLGTFTKSSQIKTTHPNDNVMSIEASDWLLPRNGVFIIMCEKSEKNHRF